MRRDEFEQHERVARDVIDAIGRASDDIQVPSHFAAQVMAKADVLVAASFRLCPFGAARRWPGCRRGGSESPWRWSSFVALELARSRSMPRGSRPLPPGFPRRRCIRRWSRNGCGKRISPAPPDSTRTPRITPPSRVTACTSWSGPVLRATCSSTRSRRRKPPHPAAFGCRWLLRRPELISGCRWCGRPLPPPGVCPPAGGWTKSPRFCARSGSVTNASCAGSDLPMAVAGTRSSTRERAGWCEAVRRPATRSVRGPPLIFLFENGSTYGVSGTTAAHFR